MNVKRALIRTAVGLTAFCAVGTAVIGVAHTPWGRPLLKLPLLSAMAPRSGCPVGKVEPADLEKVRQSALRHEVGSEAAKAHPALAFTLGESRRADVERWLAAQGAKCKPGLVKSVVECSDVALPNSPMISRLNVQFDGQERLVSVDLFRSGKEAEVLVQRFNDLGADLEERVGPATSQVGTPTAAFMMMAPLQTVFREHSYRDYVAKTTLMNFGKRGLRLREQYQWLAPEARRDPA